MADKYVLVDQSELKRVVDTYKAAMGLYDVALTWQQVVQCFDEQVACVRDVTYLGSTVAGCVVGISVSTDRNLASAAFPSAVSVLLGKSRDLSAITASGSPNIEFFSAPEATAIGSSTLNGLMPQGGTGGWRNAKGIIIDLPKVTGLPDEAFKRSAGRFPYRLSFPEAVSIGQHAFSKMAMAVSDSWSVGMYGLSAPKCTSLGEQCVCQSDTSCWIGASRTQELDLAHGYAGFDKECVLDLRSLASLSDAIVDGYAAFATYLNVFGSFSEINLHSLSSLSRSSQYCQNVLFSDMTGETLPPEEGDTDLTTRGVLPYRKIDLHSLTTLRHGYSTSISGHADSRTFGDGLFLSVSSTTRTQTSPARTYVHVNTWGRLEYLDLHSATDIPDGDLVRMPALRYLDVSSMTSLEGKGFEGSEPLETFLAGSLASFPTWLSGCANLREADLSGLSAVPANAFAACPAMETLRLNNPVAFPDEDSVRNAAGFPWGLPAGAAVFFNTRESGDSLTV